MKDVLNLIKSLPEQFQFEPVVENSQGMKDFSHIVAGGMGGSHIAPDLIKIICPELKTLLRAKHPGKRGLPLGVRAYLLKYWLKRSPLQQSAGKVPWLTGKNIPSLSSC